MLQKIVNRIAIASGVVSITVVGVAGYVFIRKDAIIENIKGKVMESVMPNIGGGALKGLSPDMGSPLAPPSSPLPSGPSIPF